MRPIFNCKICKIMIQTHKNSKCYHLGLYLFHRKPIIDCNMMSMKFLMQFLKSKKIYLIDDGYIFSYSSWKDPNCNCDQHQNLLELLNCSHHKFAIRSNHFLNTY